MRNSSTCTYHKYPSKIILQGISGRGEGSESPILRDSPAESLGKKHHISAPGGPLPAHPSLGSPYGGVLSQKNSDALDVNNFGNQDRKVSRVQKGMIKRFLF